MQWYNQIVCQSVIQLCIHDVIHIILTNSMSNNISIEYIHLLIYACSQKYHKRSYLVYDMLDYVH